MCLHSVYGSSSDDCIAIWCKNHNIGSAKIVWHRKISTVMCVIIVGSTVVDLVTNELRIIIAGQIFN